MEWKHLGAHDALHHCKMTPKNIKDILAKDEGAGTLLTAQFARELIAQLLPLFDVQVFVDDGSGEKIKQDVKYSDKNVAVIIRTGASTVGSGGWRGAYDPLTETPYTYGQQVYVTPEQAATFTEDGNQITVGGFYVWNSDDDWAGETPIHTNMPTYDSAKWVCTGTWPSIDVKCTSDGQLEYFTDSQPKPEEDE